SHPTDKVSNKKRGTPLVRGCSIVERVGSFPARSPTPRIFQPSCLRFVASLCAISRLHAFADNSAVEQKFVRWLHTLNHMARINVTLARGRALPSEKGVLHLGRR